MEVDPSDKDSKSIRQEAFRTIARTTLSANERNYMLGIIKEENGEIDWKAALGKSALPMIRAQPLDQVLELMNSRFRAEDADHEKLVIGLTISGEKRFLEVRNNILIPRQSFVGSIDGQLSMGRDTLNNIGAHITTWADAIESGDIEILSGEKAVLRLASLIE